MARARYWPLEVIRTTSPERASAASNSPARVSDRISPNAIRKRDIPSIRSETSWPRANSSAASAVRPISAAAMAPPNTAHPMATAGRRVRRRPGAPTPGPPAGDSPAPAVRRRGRRRQGATRDGRFGAAASPARRRRHRCHRSPTAGSRPGRCPTGKLELAQRLGVVAVEDGLGLDRPALPDQRSREHLAGQQAAARVDGRAGQPLGQGMLVSASASSAARINSALSRGSPACTVISARDIRSAGVRGGWPVIAASSSALTRRWPPRRGRAG